MDLQFDLYIDFLSQYFNAHLLIEICHDQIYVRKHKLAINNKI